MDKIRALEEELRNVQAERDQARQLCAIVKGHYDQLLSQQDYMWGSMKVHQWRVISQVFRVIDFLSLSRLCLRLKSSSAADTAAQPL